MELRKIKQTIEEEIEELEKGMYRYESVVKPRFEKDRQILERMRDQHIKISALIKKDERGEDITEKELKNVVPSQFYAGDDVGDNDKVDRMP